MEAQSPNVVLIVFVVIIVLAIVGVVGYFLYRRYKIANDPVFAQKVQKKAAYKAAIAPAKVKLKAAQKEYDERLRRRLEDIKAAENAYSKRIVAQEKVIAGIETLYREHIATFAGVKLYRDHFDVQGLTIELTASLNASVATQKVPVVPTPPTQEVASSSDASPEALAVSAAPVEMIDVTYLILHDAANPQEADIKISLVPANVEEARSFANMFNCAASDREALIAQRVSQLEEANGKLAAIKADRSGVEAARTALEEEKNNRAALDAAQREYDQTEYEARKVRDGLVS